MSEFSLLDTPLSGTNLIEANAGTGKTYAISKLFLRLLLEKKAAVDEILVVTFTEAATAELKERIRKDLIAAREAFSSGFAEDPFFAEIINQFEPEESEAILRNSLRLFDDVSIFTIHGFCQRSLKDNTFESGSLFEMELITDQRELMEEIIDDFWRKNLYSASPDVSGFLLDKVKSADYFMRLSWKIPLIREAVVLPQPKKILPEVIGNEKARCHALFEEMKETWKAGKQDIQALLEGDSLKAVSYGKRVAPAVAAMEQWLNSSNVASSLFKTFELFTSEKLEKSKKNKFSAPQHPFFVLCDRFEEQLARVESLLEEVLLSLEHDLFGFVKKELKARKKERNLLYFDDLLADLNEAVQKNKGQSHLAVKLRGLYKAALIDEFQDTDTLQYSIFHTLFGGGEHILCLIGDPKQAIYRFRGADIFAYLNAVEDVENRFSLQTNYRSEAGLIDAVNTIFTSSATPFLFEGIHYFPSRSSQKGEESPLRVEGDGSSAMKLCFLPRTEKVAAGKLWSKDASRAEIVPGVTSEILRLLAKAGQGEAMIGDRPLVPGDIAILVRSHREANMMKSSLDLVRVPSVMDSSENIFETEDVETITRLLQALHEPGNLTKLKAAMTTDALGSSASDLEALSKNEILLESWLIRFAEYHLIWETRGFIQMFRTFLTKEKVFSRLLSLPDGERRLTNLIQLGELLHRESVETGKGADELMKWLAKQQSSLITPEDHEIRLERDGNAVRIVTIHKSKGLEYPIVFCPFATSSSEPYSKEDVYTFHRDGQQVIALRPNLVSGAKESLQQETLAENIRLLYVALTRAKSRCYLVTGNISGYETSALAYLLHHKEVGDFFGGTAERVKKMSDGEIMADIRGLVQASNDSVEEFSLFENISLSPLNPQETEETLQSRPFTGNVSTSWRISSFTSLLVDVPRNIELPDHDEEKSQDVPAVMETPAFNKEKNVFAFPAGAKSGIFFHDLLENLDFTEKSELAITAHVAKKLEEHGFDAEWQEAVTENLCGLLATPLTKDDESLTLSSISPEMRLNELEFHYPLSGENSAKGLRELCRQSGLKTSDKGLNVDGLLYLPQEGFMKGFIDLVFQHGERFYLLDWKSNLLGATYESYNAESLHQSMGKKLYTLQYHIYTAALHRYLQYRVKGYSYDSHFGGILYIYLRGVSPSLGSSSGIFYDKPSLSTIETLL